MTIDEAIKNLTDYLNGEHLAYKADFDDAVELAIEALKRVKSMRKDNITDALFYPNKIKEEENGYI